MSQEVHFRKNFGQLWLGMVKARFGEFIRKQVQNHLVLITYIWTLNTIFRRGCFHVHSSHIAAQLLHLLGGLRTILRVAFLRPGEAADDYFQKSIDQFGITSPANG
jgi:hypothetical protein